MAPGTTSPRERRVVLPLWTRLPEDAMMLCQRGIALPVGPFDDYPMSRRPTLSKGDGVLYKALAAQLEADIRNGKLRPGTKLPPQRVSADLLDIDLSSVSKAFKLCERKGLLSS